MTRLFITQPTEPKGDSRKGKGLVSWMTARPFDLQGETNARSLTGVSMFQIGASTVPRTGHPLQVVPIPCDPTGDCALERQTSCGGTH